MRPVLVILFGALSLAACGGGGSSSGSGSGTGSSTQYSIGGTVYGLSGTVVVQLNGTESLSVSADGAFTFATKQAASSSYQVTVKTNPTGQVCVVSGGSGNVTANVTLIAVLCAPATYKLSGTLAGLTGTVVLQNNAGDDLTLSNNGPFQFATGVTSFTSYVVSVKTQPTGQTCWINNASGNSASDVSDVLVNCAATTTTAKVSGGISGYTSSGLVLRLSRNGLVVETLPAMATGATSFAFTTAMTTGDAWLVSVGTQPSSPKQTCTVANGAANIGSSSVTNVQVSCTTNRFAIGGTINVNGGALASGLVLQDNLGDDLALPAGATAFNFATKLTAPSNYNVSVKHQPTGQTCTLDRAQGLVTAVGDITNVAVNCQANAMATPLNGAYALSVGGTTLRGYLALFADGTYVFGLHRGDSACNSSGASTNGNGVEYGIYNWDAGSGSFQIVSAQVDTNDKCGLASGATLSTGTLSKGAGGVLTGTLTLPGGPSGAATLTPVTSSPGLLVGAWSVDRLGFVVYGSDNTAFQANSQSAQNYPALVAGIEDLCLAGAATNTATGSYQVSLGSGCATGSLTAVDTNGTAGLSAGVGVATTFSVAADTLTRQTATQGAVVLSRINLN
ncbi:MAG: hypothetical protein RLZZ200_1843 [Pseudomonadota bacterium]